MTTTSYQGYTKQQHKLLSFMLLDADSNQKHNFTRDLRHKYTIEDMINLDKNRPQPQQDKTLHPNLLPLPIIPLLTITAFITLITMNIITSFLTIY